MSYLHQHVMSVRQELPEYRLTHRYPVLSDKVSLITSLPPLWCLPFTLPLFTFFQTNLTRSASLALPTTPAQTTSRSQTKKPWENPAGDEVPTSSIFKILHLRRQWTLSVLFLGACKKRVYYTSLLCLVGWAMGILSSSRSSSTPTHFKTFQR